MKEFLTIQQKWATIEISIERVHKPEKPLIEFNIPLPPGREINLRFDIWVKIWVFSRSFFFYLRLY
jgi:hypothetical protein